MGYCRWLVEKYVLENHNSPVIPVYLLFGGVGVMMCFTANMIAGFIAMTLLLIPALFVTWHIAAIWYDRTREEFNNRDKS